MCVMKIVLEWYKKKNICFWPQLHVFVGGSYVLFSLYQQFRQFKHLGRFWHFNLKIIFFVLSKYCVPFLG